MTAEHKHKPEYPRDLQGDKALIFWERFSKEQRELINNYIQCNEEYYTKFTLCMDHPRMDPRIIEKGGTIFGLSTEGLKAWKWIDPAVQVEIFLDSVNGTLPEAIKFINAVWEQYKMGKLSMIQIEQGIDALLNRSGVNLYLHEGKKNLPGMRRKVKGE